MAVSKVRKNGRVMWRARVVIAGQQHARFRSTKREAEEAEAELFAIVEPAAPAVVPRTSTEVQTLAAFADEYLKNCNTTNRPQYARKKKQIMHTHLLPAFGHLRLDQIGARAIAAYRSARTDPDDPDDAVGPKWINNVVGVLLHILGTAHDWDIIQRKPKVKALRVPPAGFDFLGFDEADRLCAAAQSDGELWTAMVLTGVRTGLRLGELRGLRWRDVDLKAGRLVVNVAADELDTLHPPKSGRSREVPLGDDVIAALKAHQHPRTHVFDNADGTLLTASQCRKPLHRIARRAGLREIGWHVLRHTFASHLFMNGTKPLEVQEYMGHATLQMTLRYAHLSPDPSREAVRSLDRDRRGVTTGVTTTEPTTRTPS